MPKPIFTRERDALLTQIVKMSGTRNWTDIAAELNRRISSDSNSLQGFTGYTARQCRERWKNYLSDEPVRYNEWTPGEEQLLVTKYYELGPRWGNLAMFFAYRSTIQIKNYWHTHAARLLQTYSPDDYDSDTSPTFRKTFREMYCPSTFWVSTKQAMYFEHCTVKMPTCSSQLCYAIGADGSYHACANGRFQCAYCPKQDLTASQIEFDHSHCVDKMLRSGGINWSKDKITAWYNNTDNLKISCIHCNRSKSNH